VSDDFSSEFEVGLIGNVVGDGFEMAFIFFVGGRFITPI
jgi:hypothetical protein